MLYDEEKKITMSYDTILSIFPILKDDITHLNGYKNYIQIIWLSREMFNDFFILNFWRGNCLDSK